MCGRKILYNIVVSNIQILNHVRGGFISPSSAGYPGPVGPKVQFLHSLFKPEVLWHPMFSRFMAHNDIHPHPYPQFMYLSVSLVSLKNSRRYHNTHWMLGQRLRRCRNVQVKKVKVQIYSLISSISSDFYIFTPRWLDLFIRVSSQLHGKHTVLQPFRRIELIIHIDISVLPGNHFHQVKWSIWGLSALPKDTTSKEWPNIERGETRFFSENPAPNGIQNRKAGSDIDKAPRSSHCAMSLSTAEWTL